MTRLMRSRRSPLVLASILALQLLGGCAHREVRYFQPSASQIGPDPNSYGEVVVPLHGLIAVQGDGLAYGLARGRSRHEINGADRGQSSQTISQVLRRAIRGVEVENRGYPGDTLAQSKVRWSDSRRANLLILCFGFGDAAAHTPIDAFKSDLAQLIRAMRAQGTAVFVVTPPQLSDPLQDVDAASDVGQQEGAQVFYATASVHRLSRPAGKTIAQPAEVYQAIAGDMAPYIKVVGPSPAG